MEFYVGQKVKIKESGVIGKITRPANCIKDSWCVSFEGCDSEVYFAYHESFLEPIEDPKPEDKQTSEFKIGDRFIEFVSGQEVEIVGFNHNDRNQKTIYCRCVSDGCINLLYKTNLKPLPLALKEGQEIWVKKNLGKGKPREKDNSAYIELNFEAEDYFNYIRKEYIYIKN